MAAGLRNPAPLWRRRIVEPVRRGAGEEGASPSFSIRRARKLRALPEIVRARRFRLRPANAVGEGLL